MSVDPDYRSVWQLAESVKYREDDLNVKHRRVWNAQNMGNIRALNSAASHVFIGYQRKLPNEKLGITHNAHPTSLEVIKELQYTQFGDFKLKLPDIRYNFMIGGDGVAYEGRGWNLSPKLPAKFKYYTLESLYIGYIGNFASEGPSERMIHLRDELIWIGVMRGFISKQFTLWQLSWPYHYQLSYANYITI